MPHPVMLLVLDGFGLAPDGPGNAVALARTPNFDGLRSRYPYTELQASGRAVGLPEGQMGNSEVGHLNLGAGRVVEQSLSYIQNQIDSGALFENPVLNAVYDAAEKSGGALHLLGLVSSGGVHSDIRHLFALLELAALKGTAPVYVHVFTDGRDTPPQSGLGFVEALQAKIDTLEHDIRVASVSGRYFAMDRDNRWERVQLAYEAVVCAQSEVYADDARSAVASAYDRGETDEFIRPTVVGGGAAVRDGDAVLFFNFRADRARELTYALLDDEAWQNFARCSVPKIHYASLMEYDAKLSAPYALSVPELKHCLAEVLSRAGKMQYHTAETEKYPHVTYFFDAKIETPFPGEARQIVPSQKVATYDLKPEMSAPELTEATLERLRDVDDDFILINYANPDMVGHTGMLAATVTACETVDEGLGRLAEAVQAKGGVLIVIADHGNAEVMLDENGGPHTAHTTNPVPCIVVGAGDVRLRPGGVLGDVAPTVLELMGVAAPPEMTGKSLIERQRSR
jgi:2,3-bisphosphoglycerate-independent phosphoglycerate mutase